MFGAMTMAATSVRIAAATQKIQFERRDFQASFHWLSGGLVVSTVPVSASGVEARGATKRSCPGSVPGVLDRGISGITNPRIEPGVQQVDEQAHDDVDEHHEGDDGDDRRALAAVDRAERETAEARDVEDALGDDGTGHERAEVGAEVG